MNARSKMAVERLIELVPAPWKEAAKERVIEVLDAFIAEVAECRAASRPEGT